MNNSKPKKIAYCLATEGFGGLELSLLALIKKIDQEQWQPTVYLRLTPGNQELQNQLKILGVSYFDLEASGGILEGIKPTFQNVGRYSRLHSIRHQSGLLIKAIRQVWIMRKELRLKGYDVIHFLHGWYPSLEIPMLAALCAGIPVCISDVLLRPTSILDRQWIQKILGRISTKSVTVVRAMSKKMLWELQSLCELPSSKIRVICNGIDIESFSDVRTHRVEMRRVLGLNEGDRALAIIARLSIEKGHDQKVCLQQFWKQWRLVARLLQPMLEGYQRFLQTAD